MALGIELGEQELIRGALDPQPQRCRACGGLQPDRLDLGHREPELVAHGLADGLPPSARHVNVCGLAAPVGDGEHLVRGEETERGDRDRHAQRDAEQHVGGMIEAQVQAGEAEQRDGDRGGDLHVRAGTTRDRQAVRDAHQEDGQGRHRQRRRRVAGPAGDDRHAVGARPGQPLVDPLTDDFQEKQAAQEHQQMPPAPERRRQDDQRPAEHGDPPARARHLDPVGHVGQPRRPRPRQGAQHRGADPVIDPEPRRVLRGQERAGQAHGHQDQPRRRADVDRVRQRRRRPGRAALTAGLAHGRARRHGGPAIPGDRAADVLAQCTAPPSGISPWTRSQLPATSRGSRPASSTRASRARSVPVSSRAEILLSSATRLGP